MQQNIREKRIYKQNIENLTEQLRQADVNGTLGISCMSKSAIYPSLEKFNGNITKLEAFFAQLNLKLQYNIDYFIRERQNMKQNKLSYAFLRLERDAFAQIKSYV